MFPLSIKGSVRLKFDGAPSDRRVKALTRQIAKMLRDAPASPVSCDTNRVEFACALFRRAWPWNILFPFEAGTLEVRPDLKAIRVRYVLRTERLMTFTGAIAGLLGIGLLGVSESVGPVTLAIVLGIAWITLFSLIYVVTVIRFPLWMRNGLRDAPELRNTHSNVTAGEPVPL